MQKKRYFCVVFFEKYLHNSKKSSTFAANFEKEDTIMTVIASRFRSQRIARLREEVEENLSKAGQWMLAHPEGVCTIQNTRIANR